MYRGVDRRRGRVEGVGRGCSGEGFMEGVTHTMELVWEVDNLPVPGKAESRHIAAWAILPACHTINAVLRFCWLSQTHHLAL